MSCSCHQRPQVASMKGCSHWLSWNHSWRSQTYSGALSASHHPMRKESLQMSHSVTVLAELNTATCSSNRGGSRVTSVYAEHDHTNSKFLQDPFRYSQWFHWNQSTLPTTLTWASNVSVLSTWLYSWERCKKKAWRKLNFWDCWLNEVLLLKKSPYHCRRLKRK